MKPILYCVFSLFAMTLLLPSCKEIEDSFEKTRHPKPEREKAASKELPEVESEVSSSTVVITESETITESRSETHSDGKENNKSIFADAGELDRIQSELKNLPQFKGKELKLYQSLHFYDYQGGQISINIQNPDTTENIDTYVYVQGKWQQAQPVKITGPQVKQVDFLMPLDEIKFSTAKKVFDQTIEKAKEVSGASKVQFVYFTYMKINALKKTNAKWYTMLNGARKNVSLNFDIKGDPLLK
jgi:hypothetical protein